MTRPERCTGYALGSVLVGLAPVTVSIRADVTPRAGSVAVFAIEGIHTPEATREARVRLRSSFASSGVALDGHDVTVTVADLPKGADAAPLDLAIAAAVLRGLADTRAGGLAEPRFVFAGELSLSGDVKPIRGALARLQAGVLRPQSDGLGTIVLPDAHAAEVGLSPHYAHVRTVGKLVDLLGPLDRVVTPRSLERHVPHGREDLQGALRDVFDACRGESRILLVGRPGSGKTMLARRLASQAKPLSRGDALEVASIYSAAGILASLTASYQPPFRAPHYTVSSAALLGGGSRIRPGEVTLAHRGVLFLDELTEFRRGVLQELASVLRGGRACGGRMPAAPSCVVASANPCPCGYGESPLVPGKPAIPHEPRLAGLLGTRVCRCSPSVRESYVKRLEEYASILGVKRFDVPDFRLQTADLGESKTGEGS